MTLYLIAIKIESEKVEIFGFNKEKLRNSFLKEIKSRYKKRRIEYALSQTREELI